MSKPVSYFAKLVFLGKYYRHHNQFRTKKSKVTKIHNYLVTERSPKQVIADMWLTQKEIQHAMGGKHVLHIIQAFKFLAQRYLKQ